MRKIINFTKQTFYFGRNRMGKATGVEVTRDGNTVRLNPVNTRGCSDAAILTIPIADITAVTAAMRGIECQTSLFSYSTNGAYRGTIQIVAENLACANTALVNFLDEEETAHDDPPMTADDWTLNFIVPVGGDIRRFDGNMNVKEGESIVLDWDWTVSEK